MTKYGFVSDFTNPLLGRRFRGGPIPELLALYIPKAPNMGALLTELMLSSKNRKEVIKW